MKFDPYTWKEEVAHEEIEVPKGRVQLRLSAVAPVYCCAQGYEILVGVASSFDFEISEPMTIRAEGPNGMRLFRHVPEAGVRKSVGEVFTNIDKLPGESFQMQEVRRALRQLELNRREALREIRAEAAALRAASPAPAAAAASEAAQSDEDVKAEEVAK